MSKNDNNFTWESINWPLAIDRVCKLQRRIYKTKTINDKHGVYGLQKLLINTLDAKLCAVRKVSTNVKMLDSEKVNMALKLNLNGKALFQKPPVISAYFSHSSKEYLERYLERYKERENDYKKHKLRKYKKHKKYKGYNELYPFLDLPYSFSVVQDRAKQELAKLCLEPEWEAVFEANSYGFRLGRTIHDAIESVSDVLTATKDAPRWVAVVNIGEYLNKINSFYFLEKLQTFPQMKDQIGAWLKTGITEEFAHMPKKGERRETNIQIGPLSPLLLNIALHGLESYLKEKVLFLKDSNTLLYNTPQVKQKIDVIGEVFVVRYGNELLIFHLQREVLDFCIDQTHKWLLNVGLKLSTRDFVVKDCWDNFHFLGFTINKERQNQEHSKGKKVRIVPSRESQLFFLDKIRSIIKNNRSVSTYGLISKLRPLIVNWINYYKHCDCSFVFTKLSHLLFQIIRHWVFRRHPQEGRTLVKEKYWPSERFFYYEGSKHYDNWVLCGKSPHGVENFLPQLRWVYKKQFEKIKGTKSPFDSDNAYWAVRNCNYSGPSSFLFNLYKVQNGNCSLCKNLLNTFSKLEVTKAFKTFQLVHESCHLKKVFKQEITKRQQTATNDKNKKCRER